MTPKIYTAPQYRKILALSKSGDHRARIAGLLPPPIQLGLRSVGLPAHEVEILAAAKIAQKSEEETKAIVQRLVAARSVDLDAMLENVGA